MVLNEKQVEMCETSRWDFSDLSAMILNCTLKRSPEMSHTQSLIDMSKAIMEKDGVTVECLRPVDYGIAYGVWLDTGWRSCSPFAGDEYCDVEEFPHVVQTHVLSTSDYLTASEARS